MIARILLLTFAFVLTAAFAPARQDPMDATAAVADPTLKIAVEPAKQNDIEIGERIPLAVRPGTAVPLTQLTLTLPPEQKATARIEKPLFENGAWTAAIRVLKSGDQAVGPITARGVTDAGEKIEFKPVSLAFRVKPSLAKEDTALEDFGAPVAMTYDWTWRNLAYGLGAVLVALGLWLAWRQLAKRASRVVLAPPPPPVPPIDEARGALAQLATLHIFDREGPEQHYTALSLLLRRYVEREYGVQALEMTDDEMVRFFRNDLGDRAGAAALPEVFTRSSAAKFARQALDKDVARLDCDSVDSFLSAEQSRIATARAAQQLAAAAGRPRTAAGGAA